MGQICVLWQKMSITINAMARIKIWAILARLEFPCRPPAWEGSVNTPVEIISLPGGLSGYFDRNGKRKSRKSGEQIWRIKI